MFSAFEKGQKHLFCPNVVSVDNIQTTFINLLRVANMSSFIVNKMCVPVLSECCLQGRHLDNIHNICLCYFLQKHVFKKFRHFKKVNLKSAASLNYVVFFSKPRISLHWFVPMLSAKQHSHKRSRMCFGWRQIDLKESSKKTFF